MVKNHQHTACLEVEHLKLRLVDRTGLFPPVPVLATESLAQFEKIFDQLVASLKCQDMVELIQIRDFAVAAWEEARYTRHRVVAFDRKFKDVVEGQLPNNRDPAARQKALAERLAEHLVHQPRDVGHLVELEAKAVEVDRDVTALLKRTPAELAYNQALERNINFHKDLEFLITSIRKRRNEALEMLDCYRQGLGRRAEQIMVEILDAEFNLVAKPGGENQVAQVVSTLAPLVVPQAEPEQGADHPAPTAEHRPEAATARASSHQHKVENQDGVDA